MEYDEELKARLRYRLQALSKRVPELPYFCNRCLNTERYGGNVVLMVLDASFMSIGVSYFNVVVPAVLKIKSILEREGISGMRDFLRFLNSSLDELYSVWRNKRSWNVAKGVMGYLSNLSVNDKKALRMWAKDSDLENWKEDPIGCIKGIGINTYQYLRMMGGVDTVMPDKIVRKVLSKEIGDVIPPPEDDISFIRWVEEIAELSGYRAIELCWLTWFVQYSDDVMKKYRELMYRI
jgi:hypothetical protein